MDLSDFYSGLERNPDAQQYIVQEMTALITEEPANAQAYFRRGNAFSDLHDYYLIETLVQIIVYTSAIILAQERRLAKVGPSH